MGRQETEEIRRWRRLCLVQGPAPSTELVPSTPYPEPVSAWWIHFRDPPRCCLARPGASHFRPTLPTSLQVRLAGKRHLLGCQLVRHYDGSSLQPADSVIVTKSTVLSFHLLTSCSSPRTPCVLSAYGYKGKLVAGLRQRLAGSLTTYRRIFFCKQSSTSTAFAARDTYSPAIHFKVCSPPAGGVGLWHVRLERIISGSIPAVSRQ